VRKSLFSPEYDVFCGILRELLAERDVSQNQLSKRLKMSQSSLNKTLWGHRRMDVLELVRFCAALDVEPDTVVIELKKRLTGRHNQGES
jgi:DNA-binding Xre family transcriptional regulator